MSPIEVLDLVRESLYVLLKISVPIMMVALIVGLLVALFQALTQIQEMTLTFVPKIIAIFFAMIIFLPYMMETMLGFTEGIADKIITVEERDGDL